MTSHDGPDEKPSPRRLIRHDSENTDWDRDLVEHSRDLLCIHDLQGRLLSVNPSPARLLGYSVEELLRIPMRDMVPPEVRPAFDEYLQTIARDGEARGLLAIVTRSGEHLVWEYHNTLRTQGVEAPVVRGVAHDVTERVRAEKALREANKKLVQNALEQEGILHDLTLFRALLDQSHDAIEVVDPETLRFLDVNERACLELGYSREELLSMTVFDIDRNINEDWRAWMQQQMQESEFAILERVHRRKDGTTFPVEVNTRKVRLDRDYRVGMVRDITARKRRDERLQEYERVLESLDEMITVVNRDHRYVLANSAFLRYRGMAKHQVVGHPITDVIPEDIYHSTIKPQLDECFRGHVVNFDMKFNYPGMGERDLTITYLPVEGPAGIDRVAAILRDVTEQKRATALLEESERRFRAVYERAPVGISLVDSQSGRFLQVNPRFCEIVGRNEEEMLQLSFRDVTHPEDIAGCDEYFKSFEDENTRLCDIEKRYARPDGSVVWANISVVPMGELGRGQEHRSNMAIVQDITERRQAEQALRESEEHLLLAQEAAQIGTFARNFQTGECQWTPQMEALYGLPHGGFPKTIDKFLELIHPDDRQQVARRIAQSNESGEAQGEWRVIWPDSTVHWIFGRWRVFKDASGKAVRISGMDFDITERKQVEQDLRQAKERLTEEKLYLEHEIDTELGFEDIIGQSKALKAVMESVGKVATTDAAVLLLGETGTGKELIARAIHRLSRRAGNSFIKMNCAAIPSGLLESELFGNERGAFTGAVSRKIGRLELADKGTIFLDEIGEISLALQPKLLRVLQDQEFERLGGTQTIKVNFRLIAATNRDLAESVRESEFRSDLFYRLNVFPIRLPPLRERRDDIPLLVERFVQKCSRRMNKSITSVPTKTMDALVGSSWPGNVRELENFIERSVILTNGSVLAAPLNELQPMASIREEDETLKAKEREHILRALQQSHGQISGPRGAATRLGLKRTTLQSKLKHLGINPRIPPQGSP